MTWSLDQRVRQGARPGAWRGTLGAEAHGSPSGEPQTVVFSKDMRPIIIGAGRGSRLEHLTEEIPKTLVPVMGRPMLDWVLEALAAAGFSRKDVVFICGYRAEVIRERYPEFTYVENTDWERNNILLSLICAREHLKDGFVSTYADIVYRGDIVRGLVASKHDKVLGCDTDWRRRYVDRTHHPETDAEKLTARRRSGDAPSAHHRLRAGGRRVHRRDQVHAGRGPAEVFDGVRRRQRTVCRQGVPRRADLREGVLIDLFQDMLEGGSKFHRVDTHGGYMEIDTLEDRGLAASWWAGSQIK